MTPAWRSILAELLGGAGCACAPPPALAMRSGLLRREKFDLAVVDLTLTPGLPGAPEEPRMAGGCYPSPAPRASLPWFCAALPIRMGFSNTFAEFEVFAYLAKQTFDRRAFSRPSRQPAAAARLLRRTSPPDRP